MSLHRNPSPGSNENHNIGRKFHAHRYLIFSLGVWLPGVERKIFKEIMCIFTILPSTCTEIRFLTISQMLTVVTPSLGFLAA